MKEENVKTKETKKEKELNVYQKVQIVKEELLKANLKKSGLNKFAGFTYYELSDFLPTIITLCNKVGLFTRVSYDSEIAQLEIINVEKPSEFVLYSSPMKELELKGCNAIQNLGGVETYSRRYLYMSAFDIIENDMFDSTSGKNEICASEEQLAILRKTYVGDNLTKLLKLNGVDKLEDLPKKTASDLISKLANLKKGE